MKCQICEAEASFHYTEIKDDKIVDLHLCAKCAKEKGLTSDQDSNLILADMLSGLSGIDDFVKDKPEEKGPVCSKCGLKFSQFQKSGKFGCGYCYTDFSKEVTPLLKKIHGSLQHTGKKPLRMGKSLKNYDMIKELKQELQKAISNEKYEQAAQLRDKIKKVIDSE